LVPLIARDGRVFKGRELHYSSDGTLVPGPQEFVRKRKLTAAECTSY